MEFRVDWKRVLISAAVLSLLSILAWPIYMSYVGNATLNPQSQAMLIRSRSWELAFRPSAWPPGYALTLLAARKINFPLEQVNLTFFSLTLFLLFVVSRKGFPNISPFWLPVLYSLCAFNYYNIAQLTSEAIIVPLSLMILLCLASYQQKKTLRSVLILSLCCALLFISRFQVVLWLAPIVVLNLFFSAPADWKKKILHWGSFLVIGLAPLGFVLLTNYQKTGYLTGMERFDWSARNLPEVNQYFATSTGFLDNVFLTFKTYFLDFFSPYKYAEHLQNRASYSISILEAFVLTLFGLAILRAFLALGRQLKEHGSLSNFLRAKRQSSPIAMLATEFFLGYILVTILAWTVGNNDPLYSRFLYPSYVFFMVAMFSGFALVKGKDDSRWGKLFFVGLYLSLAILQTYKIAQTLIHHYSLVG